MRDDTSHVHTPTDRPECARFVAIDFGNEDDAKV
jgi:hypothetical protein